MSLYLGWWAYPIYGTDGDYLQLMKDTISDAGEWNEAWNLTEDEKKMLKDSSGWQKVLQWSFEFSNFFFQISSV